MVGGLVQQQHIRPRRQGTRQRRTRELTAGEATQLPVEILPGESQPSRHRGRAVAPQIAAACLQPRLRTAVAVEQRLTGRPTGHLPLKLAQLCLDLQLILAPGEHIVAQRQRPLAWRALVVQRDPHSLRHAQLAPVDLRLPREHPQQRRLARAVAPRDRHPFAALQLERHTAQQRLPGHVLVQVGCDQYGHRLLIVGAGPRGPACSGSIHPAMRRLLATFTSSVLLLLALAPAALAENDGRGLYGATNDKVVTNAGFILIIFFPTFVFVMSMLQRKLEKRKEANKAAKTALDSAARRGGW